MDKFTLTLQNQSISLQKILDKETAEINIPSGEKISLVDDSSCSDIKFTLGKDSSLKYFSKVKHDKNLKFSLNGEGASVSVRSICEGHNDEQYKINTIQHHIAPNTESYLEIRGVLHDSSKLFCNNLIRIEKDAQKVKANEQNKNLLLGSDARVVSIPKLEVEADDVSCQHGAAISRIDDSQMFYLQSRGIDKELAKKLLIEAFLN